MPKKVKRVQFNLRLSAEELAELRELAAGANLTASELVRLSLLSARGTARALAAGDLTVEELRKGAMVQLRIEGT